MSVTAPPRPAPAAAPPSPNSGSRFQRWLASWRVSLKMARRDALRYKGRSALVVVMVTLPVALIVSGLSFATSAAIGLEERLPSLLGPAQAIIHDPPVPSVVTQGVDGTTQYGSASESGQESPAKPVPGYDEAAPLSERTAALQAVVGATVVPISTGDFRYVLGDRKPYGSIMYVDPGVDLKPKVELVSGRLPAAPDEIAVTPAGLNAGLPESGAVEAVLAGRPHTLTVVGVAHALDPDLGMTHALGADLPPEMAQSVRTQWLVLRDSALPWDEVRKLNGYGLSVTSAEVVRNPPPASSLPGGDYDREAQADSEARLMAAIFGAVLFLVTALLVGPAFAVSAGRQRRSLALAASNGAETKQLRRSVLAGALILGAFAAVLGAALGAGAIAAATATYRSMRPWTTAIGPFDMPWVAAAVVLVCAILAALTAALIPALRLGRLDIVGVMKGQNVSPPANRIFPLIGIVLFALGAVGLFIGVTSESSTPAVAGVFGLVIGAVLLIPILLVLAGRVAGRLPVAMRMATRDAARQRHRSAPTVAAVMAGAALLSTFAIALQSDTEFQRKHYSPSGIPGEAQIYGIDPTDDPLPALRSAHPTWKIEETFGVGHEYDPMAPDPAQDEPYPYLAVLPKGCTPADAARAVDPMSTSMPYEGCQWISTGGAGSTPDASIVIMSADEIIRRLGLTGAQAQVVRGGGVAIRAAERIIEDGKVTLSPGTMPIEGAQPVSGTPGPPRTVEAIAFPTTLAPGAAYGIGALIPTETARAMNLPLIRGNVFIHDPKGPISQEAEDAVNENAEYEFFHVERGFERSDRVIMWGVFGIAGFLLVVVTLISTALALAEQQADLGTLAAVGATKGTRRRFAAAQAATVAILGGLLGIAIGAVSGVAIAYPSTTTLWDNYGNASSVAPTIGIPAVPMLAILVGVPLIAAAIAAASIRRAPHVTRRGN